MKAFNAEEVRFETVTAIGAVMQAQALSRYPAYIGLDVHKSVALPIGQDVAVPRSTGMCESGQVIEARFSAGVRSCASIDVTRSRYVLFGAKTP